MTLTRKKRALGECFDPHQNGGIGCRNEFAGKAILGIGTALGVSAGVLSPWILAIEGIIAAIVLLTIIKTDYTLFEGLGEKLVY